MIRSLTIIGNDDGKGKVEFSFQGDLPLDECARAIVLFALQIPRTEQKKGEIKTMPTSDVQTDPGTG